MHIGANVGRITLAARWGPNLGEYMMHCHNNVHEDNDMFRAFMVRPRLCSYACPVALPTALGWCTSFFQQCQQLHAATDMASTRADSFS